MLALIGGHLAEQRGNWSVHEAEMYGKWLMTDRYFQLWAVDKATTTQRGSPLILAYMCILTQSTYTCHLLPLP